MNEADAWKMQIHWAHLMQPGNIYKLSPPAARQLENEAQDLHEYWWASVFIHEKTWSSAAYLPPPSDFKR